MKSFVFTFVLLGVGACKVGFDYEKSGSESISPATRPLSPQDAGKPIFSGKLRAVESGQIHLGRWVGQDFVLLPEPGSQNCELIAEDSRDQLSVLLCKQTTQSGNTDRVSWGYWKNESWIALVIPPAFKNPELKFVRLGPSGEVWVAGLVTQESGGRVKKIPMLWKDATPVELQLPGEGFVVRNLGAFSATSRGVFLTGLFRNNRNEIVPGYWRDAKFAWARQDPSVESTSTITVFADTTSVQVQELAIARLKDKRSFLSVVDLASGSAQPVVLPEGFVVSSKQKILADTDPKSGILSFVLGLVKISDPDGPIQHAVWIERQGWKFVGSTFESSSGFDFSDYKLKGDKLFLMGTHFQGDSQTVGLWPMGGEFSAFNLPQGYEFLEGQE